ncbi:MAG: TrmH family RNA methyltransferase [Bdellovibrionota bacterium]
MSPSRLRIVLHRSIYPRNIGMCARAMANMGLSNLILIDAVSGSLDGLGVEAKQGAAHAQEVLANAKFYVSDEEFFASEGEGIRIALSGKDARIKTPDDLGETLVRAFTDTEHRLRNTSDPIYLFFGAEDDGLTPEIMERCHFVCRLPTFTEVNSLNLSHAVLLASFIVRQSLEAAGVSDRLSIAETPKPLDYPHSAIHQWLELLGFDLSSPRINIEKTLNRILLSRCPTSEELRVVENVIHQTVRKLRKSE